jgi:uncharacterized protein (DUF58 family)
MLSPSVVAAIDDLELAARVVVEGLRSGQHRSPLHGYTAEFSQHRPYRAGDDLKYLDWKILARTDRLYSRQFREMTNMGVMLVVDASASMAFPERGVSKWQYARVASAALAHLVSTAGDAVGLMTMSGDSLRYQPAKGGRTHLRAITSELARLEPGGVWQPQRVLARAAELLSRRGLIVVLSDFYDAEADTQRELRRAATRGHDVAVLQVVSPEEMTFPYSGDLDLEDLETGSRQVVDGGEIRAHYRGAIADFLERCRSLARRAGLDYALFTTDTPPERALRQFLLRRQGR